MSTRDTVLRMQPGDSRPVAETHTGLIRLEQAQKWVEGYVDRIEIASLGGGRAIDLLLNEEGKLEELEPTIGLMYNGGLHDVVVGPVAFVAVDSEGNWEPLNHDEQQLVEGMFLPWVVLNMGMIPTLEPLAWRERQHE